MPTHRFTSALILALASATGCASAPKLPVFGTWRVASYTTPGVTKPSSVQALAWVGVSASFEEHDARVGGDRCSSPTYTARTLSAAEFQTEFKATTSTLGITEPVTVYQVKCGSQWGAATDTLIVKSPAALLTPWNGIYFELQQAAPRLEKK